MNAKYRTLAGFAFAFAIAISLYVFWERSPQFARAEPNPYCNDIVVRVFGQETILPEDLRLGPGKGQYATLEFTPIPNFPTEVEGMAVQSPRFWTLALKLYQKSTWPDEEGVRFLDCCHFENDHRKLLQDATPLERQKHGSRVVFGGADLWTSAAGFSGEPEYLAETKNPWGRRWTLFATPHDSKPGDEFVYELVLFPHAHMASATRQALGPTVVLRRGLITVD